MACPIPYCYRDERPVELTEEDLFPLEMTDEELRAATAGDDRSKFRRSVDDIWLPANDSWSDSVTTNDTVDDGGPLEVSLSDFVTFSFRIMGEMGLVPFSFEGRRHIKDIYDDSPSETSKKILLKTARQVEKSTMLGNIALSYSCLVAGHKTLYVSPSSTQTKTFSNDRLKDPIETSSVLKSFTNYDLSQNVFRKSFINGSSIELRNAYLNADRTRGIPAYKLLIDEIQDILERNIPVIEQCTGHAPDRWRSFVYAGTPKSTDNTIETWWSQHSTQGEWVVPCDRCGSKSGTGRFWNILGEKNIGLKGLSCERCGNLIDPMHKDAQWAFQTKWDPAATQFKGYRIPQLMVPWKPWSEILYNYRSYPRAQFYNEILGLSYDSGTRPLNIGQVKNECNPRVSMHPSELDKYRKLSYSHPIFMGVDWGCHDEETRILTEDGFRYFRELTGKERVAQWDPDTRKMTFVEPKVLTVRDWDKPLLHFKTDGYDLMVTDTHRMRTGTRQSSAWLTESAGKTAARGGAAKFVGYVGWDGEERETFMLPGVARSAGYAGSAARELRMDDWLELLGYFISEGGVCLRGDDQKPYCIKMSQRASANHEKALAMKACMGRLGIPFSEFPNEETSDLNWTICGKQYWRWYADNIGMHGDAKRIPREFLALSKRQLRILFEALVDGDGSRDPREGCTGGSYFSTSRALCEDFQELCIRLGMRCIVSLHAEAAGNRKTRWRASWSEGRDHCFNAPNKNVEHVPYSGKVYCCAVPSGYIVTERNGRIAYQGNTGENTYTVVTLGTYVRNRFRIFYAHRFTGQELEPKVQLQLLMQMIKQYNVHFIGTDYGGGYDRNDVLIRKFGPTRVRKYQYMGRTKKKLEWDSKLGRFKVHRTEVMSDVFNAIKRHQFEFPRFEEWNDPYAQDMCNNHAEYNTTLRMMQYDTTPGKTDDTFHSVLYCFLASQLEIPRPDILVPKKELAGIGPRWAQSWTDVSQG